MKASSMYSSAGTALIIALGAAPLQGQEPRDTVRLSELVVTADRVPAPPAKVTAATTIVTGEELRERGFHALADALRGTPGAAVVSTGSFGGITSVFLRGGESDYVKVLVDGVPLNQDGGSYDFASLTTDNIDRIEIVRGPTSVLYGSEAMTGVIQIFTRSGAGPAHGEVSVRGGTFGTWQADAAVTAGSDRSSFAASVSRFSSEGIHPFNSDYRNTAASASARLVPDDRTRIVLSLRTGDTRLNVPTDFSGSVVDSNAFSLRQTVSAGLDLARVLRGDLTLNIVLASYADDDDSDNRPDSPGDSTGFFQSLSQGTFRRRSAEARLLLERSAVRVTLGTIAEFEDLRESSQSLVNFGGGAALSASAFNASRRNLGVYGQVLTDLTPGTLVNLGARLDDNEGFGTHITFRLGAVQQIFRRTRLRGSLGTGFKEPSLRENYANSPFERGNPELDPERSRSWELGVEHTVVADRAVVTATYFDQHFRDLIQYRSPSSPADTTYFNVARATSRGIEASLALRPTGNLSFGVFYTWLKTRVEDSGFDTQPGDVFREGDRLIRRPTHSVRLDARYHLARRATLGATLTRVGQRDDVDFRPFPSIRAELPGYTMLDLDATLSLPLGRSGVEVSPGIRVENALDEEYETVVGFPGRRRTVLAGARVRF